MSKGALADLAARVETATGPDRELDCLIREALDSRYQPQQRVMYYGEPTGEHVEPVEGHFSKSPGYTASLDAAMTLVPEHCLWTMDSYGFTAWSAGIWHGRKWLVHTSTSRPQRTPALALTAAALRARATSGGDAPNQGKEATGE